jgi:glycosyltransferase involved in cell wall biosynthesis
VSLPRSGCVFRFERNRGLVVEQERLTVIMPVANNQSHLAAIVERVLEFVTDLTHQVQLLVVDDGSTDATAEILEDLRCTYPQISSVRIPRKVGPARAVQAAIPRALGDFIFLHESYDPVDLESLSQLWNLRHDRDLVVARSSTRRKRIDEPLLRKLAEWGKSLEEYWTRETKSLDDKPLQKGLQMMRREAVEKLARVDPQQSDLEVSHLSQRRLIRDRPAISGTP